MTTLANASGVLEHIAIVSHKLSPAMRAVLLEEFGAEAGEYTMSIRFGQATGTVRALARRDIIVPTSTFPSRRWTLTPLGAQVRAALVPETPAK